MTEASTYTVDDIEWDDVSDVVVVGAGAAGLSAALGALHEGASVLVLERADTVGGTTAKSSGGMWVPDNPLMRENDLTDPRDEALAYMARISYPALFTEAAPRYGLPELE